MNARTIGQLIKFSEEGKGKGHKERERERVMVSVHIIIDHNNERVIEQIFILLSANAFHK